LFCIGAFYQFIAKNDLSRVALWICVHEKYASLLVNCYISRNVACESGFSNPALIIEKYYGPQLSLLRTFPENAAVYAWADEPVRAWAKTVWGVG
jgi:hypothetical protein